MWGDWTREKQAQFNKENRLELYKKAIPWAAIGGIGPIGFFLSENVLNTPKPVSATFEGYQSDGAPLGDTYEVYSYEWASGADHALSVMGFVLGIFAAVAVALLFYGIARFIADPIMYRIDLKTEQDSNPQLWLKRIVMILVVLLYCGTMAFAGEYKAYPDDEYVWLSEGNTHIRVDKDEYDKYMNDTDNGETKATEPTTEPATEPTTEPATEPTTEDLSKTPVERGYPSNDLDYYIEHPNEPMPKELLDEIMKDSYDPGSEYVPGEEYNGAYD